VKKVSLDDLRRFAVARSFAAPTSLARAIAAIGFVQADPIRAPARAQDLTLRHRVADYRAGDLERAYPTLEIEEDTFINYGFVTRDLHALMHPRAHAARRSKRHRERAQAVLAFVRERGVAHPREVDRQFSHGRVTNYWGGSSSATTHLLGEMHYDGLLRVARRVDGVRLYAAHDHLGEAPPDDEASRRVRVDALVDVVVRKYAPLPSASLSTVISRLRYAAPQYDRELKSAQRRARERLSHAEVGGVEWYWPVGETPALDGPPDMVRLLTPFDPLVWDRRRFEMFWGWAYRFEAYTPKGKRRLGYYALPLLWRDRVIGWGNVSLVSGACTSAYGYAQAAPRDRAFRRELDDELERMRGFLVP
jgi:uncharacterized protein YcaQ